MTASLVIDRQLERLAEAFASGTTLVDHDLSISERWRKDPFAWARERLKIPLRSWGRYAPQAYLNHVWDGTREPLRQAAMNLGAGHSVAVSSATGIGKTYLGAVLILWFLDCWQDSQVVTLAPKKDQLILHIWKELARLMPQFKKLHPKAELLTLELRVRPGEAHRGWGAVGFPCGVAADEIVANRARGFHNEHLLFIVEETTGVHSSLLEAIALTCTAPHNLRVFFGNPDSDADSLAQAADDPGVMAIRASALDHPNVVADDPALVPGATSRKVLEEWREKYGEESPLYCSRARGIAPGQATHALIRREWCEAAAVRAQDPVWAMTASRGKASLGFDVAASEEGDRASTCFGRGTLVTEINTYKCPDANAWARQHVWPMVDSGLVEQARCGGDPIGVGHGAFMELKRLGAPNVVPLNGGESYWKAYANDEKFGNLRCQMYWQARMDLQHGLLGIPEDLELIGDLTAPLWETRNGSIWVESKEHFKKRLGRSPDRGDAFVYWNWVRQASKHVVFTGNATVASF